MNMIELHILQSFPVTCLNRDDVGAPKTAVFGGVQRARVSSQSWKRAIRTLASEGKPSTIRGQYMASLLADELKGLGVESATAIDAAETTIDAIAKTDKKKKREDHKSSVALFLSKGEISAIAVALNEQLAATGKVEIKKGSLAKAISSAHVKDAADIAVFGRMVAEDHTLTVEGAGLFSHALSTHAASNELDFFSAVDETKPDQSDAGGSHINNLEFNSACYYRYVGINLELLARNLGGALANDEVTAVLSAFLKAAILAVPNARKNSMFGFNPPAYVLGIRRSGQPLSLANAFERPVISGQDGYAKPSETALRAHWSELKERYCLATDTETELPPENLDVLIAKLTTGTGARA